MEHELRKEIDELRGKLLAHGLVLKCLLTENPSMAAHLMADLSRSEDHSKVAQELGPDQYKAYRSELTALAEPLSSQDSKASPESP